MSKFPEAPKIPAYVPLARKDRTNTLIKTSLKGIALRLFIAVVELTAVYFYGSSALFMDALSSMVDVASSIFLIVCLKLAAAPPDEDHPFGHGRYEPIAGLQLGLLLLAVGGGMFFQQVFNAPVHTQAEQIHWLLWIIPLGATLILEGCYQFIVRTAKAKQSPALVADAVHYRIDAITSLFAFIALVMAAIFPDYSGTIDHIGAILIAVVMMIVGFFASKENFNQIVDKVPDELHFQQVRKAALKVKGVKETEKIRIQQYGPDAQVNIDIEVDPKMTVDEAHKISQEVKVEILKAWPAVRNATVHIEPYYPNDH